MKQNTFRALVMFPKTEDSHFDMDYFLERHVPLATRVLGKAGLVDFEVQEGVALPPPVPAVRYTVIASLIFSSFEALERALVTHAATFRADGPNFTTVSPIVQVNRVLNLSQKAPLEAEKGILR